MNGEVRLDPDRLRDRGARLAELGDRVGQTHAGLRDSLAHAEGSWGDDDLGVAFAREFKPHADQLLANLRAMQESLHSVAAGMVDAAGQFEVQDRFGATRVGTSADGLAPIGEAAAPWPHGSVGTSPLADAQPVTSDPVTTFPAAADPAYPPNPAYPANRADSTERSAPGGSRTPDASAGRSHSTPEGGPLRDSSDRAAGRDAARGVDGPGSGNPGKPAGESGRRPAAVFPPAATRDAPRAPAGQQAAVGPPGGVGRRDTPWSGQPPRTAGPPAGAQPRPSSPRFDSPPRKQKPADKLPPGRDRRRPGARPVAHPMVGWLARTLAEHHGVRVAGFDTPGLQVAVIRAFVAAVDRVLTDYPMISLDVVAVRELDPESAPVWWSAESRDTRGTGAGRSITLDQRAAQESSQATGTAESDAESAELGTYLATLGEFGRALDFAGGGLARRRAQRVLIAEYLRLEGGPNSTLAEVVSGYRRWRAELTGDVGGFDVSRALGAAFADVVLRGDEASLQARALHAALVDATSQRG
ncbi:WXG100 family type VII secretion target [Nocardia gipuzkoensis]|uniref:WXG100 family type VII secretion target n=1 Tax=Nocardia gipuzkoensis TaxID=2749991 RepID=UPI0015EFC3B8|nr:WXG100 family type VII secretion target [Nocardia gipuzkoensis]